jgi:DNA-binding GntR family transcriptional regulator
MEKIRQGSLYGEAAQRIRTMIKDGRLKPGTRVPEKQLCEQFGVSRTPLREALKVLASEGFVELLPNRGARVVQLTRRMLKDTLDVMAALEGLSGELACQHVSAEEIDTMRHLHKQMIAHYEAGDLSAYFEVNQRIHETLVAAARNEVLLETYNNLNERVRRFRFSQQMSPALWEQVVGEHEQILQALEARDSQRMGAILRGHLKHKLDRVAVDDAPDADELAS